MADLASPPRKDPRNHWSKEEHAQFLEGVAAHGRGEWAAIARDFVPTRTGTQVSTHGQKYFAKLDRDRGVASVSAGASASASARASLDGDALFGVDDDARAPNRGGRPRPAPTAGELDPRAAAGDYGAPNAEGFYVTARGALRCFRCNTCVNRSLKRPCLLLPERSGSATGKQSSSAAAERPGTLPHVFNAFGRRPKFTATWRRERETRTETETEDARADSNPRGKRARAWVRDSAGAGADGAAASAADDDRASVTLYGETHDAIPPGGSIVDALATPGVSACPPATRSYLGGPRGGGDLARACAGAVGALFRTRATPFAKDLDRRASGGDEIAAAAVGAAATHAEEEERFGADGLALARHVCSEPGCGKFFYDAGKLRKHSLTHGEKAFPCRYADCGKRFLDASKLKRHWLTHDGVEGQQHLCPYAECCLPFATRRAVSEHVVLEGSHEDEKFYWCPVESCPKRFAKKAKMLEHLKSHGTVDWETGI